MPIAGYMCTPRKVLRKYNRNIKNIWKNTQAISYKATRIWCTMEEMVQKVDGQKSKINKPDQPQQCNYIGSRIRFTELGSPQFLQGEGFEQLV